MIIAIDPGPLVSAFVHWDLRRVVERGDEVPNHVLLERLRFWREEMRTTTLAVEKVTSHGLPAGAPLFETVYWSGRFIEAWDERALPWLRVPYHSVGLFLCQVRRAKESHVRRALMDAIGEPGTAKNPGACYGVHGHCWSALALAYAVGNGVNS